MDFWKLATLKTLLISNLQFVLQNNFEMKVNFYFYKRITTITAFKSYNQLNLAKVNYDR